ncbi:MAG: SUMF1/EgtB/PvdO family nonheme iron enzyme [Acidobacteriota bacterium]|nr:SUMF1/EgtB/PvdO family nonheme iron enzyme [Acidobacteriota bacterium]
MKECPACKLCFPDDVLRCPNDGDPTNHTIVGEPVLDGRYQLIKRLGQGGMGVVYKARHTYLKTAHAIKVILPDLVGNDPNLITRFRQEALAAAAIRHRNIVSVTDFGVVAGKMPFLVMEHVEGESLHDLLVREKRLTPKHALEILSAICSGLAAAHKQDIVHRDLKPLNIMIVRDAPLDEAVKILDFGLAKIKSGELLGSFIQAQTTGLMGSPYYMAPEQWSDDEPDVRADVYSLGVILYQMLAGDVPFKGSSIPSIMRKHLSDPPPPLTDFGLNLPPSIEQVVRHALEKDPALRTPTVEKLTQEFREALKNPVPAVPAPKKAPEQIVKEIKPDPKPKTPARASKVFAAAGEPSATLRVLTNPPESLVFLNGEKLGASEANGWLVAENIKRGTHKLRVVKNNHTAFEAEITCDSEVCQTVAQLQSLAATNLPSQINPEVLPKNAIPQETFVPGQAKTEKPVGKTNVPAAAPELDLSLPLPPPETVQKSESPAAHPFAIKSYPDAREPDPPRPETKREAVKTQPETAPITTLKSLNNSSRINVPIQQTEIESEPSLGINIAALAAAFVIGLLLVAGGGYAVYRLLFAPSVEQKAQNTPPANSSIQKPADDPRLAVLSKIEMVSIPGGEFLMGANSGQELAKPAFKVKVEPFQMGKFEVTNAQYAEFVKETGYKPPPNWINGQYLPEEENLPVTTVSLENAQAFAEWRSEKDGVEYDLPTEQQWEYAARNGEQNDLYPWGESWEESRAVTNETSVKPIGSAPIGANKWGVQDLIGNVWEWTKTPFANYPGGKAQIRPGGIVARGGSCRSATSKEPITSAYRNAFEPTRRDPLLGFRLVIN